MHEEQRSQRSVSLAWGHQKTYFPRWARIAVIARSRCFARASKPLRPGQVALRVCAPPPPLQTPSRVLPGQSSVLRQGAYLVCQP